MSATRRGGAVGAAWEGDGAPSPQLSARRVPERIGGSGRIIDILRHEIGRR
jgi:hypothetical protein